MNPPYLRSCCPGGGWGLGVTHSLQAEEASNEFLFKFFIPDRGSRPGRPGVVCSESQPLSGSGKMSSPGYELMG